AILRVSRAGETATPLGAGQQKFKKPSWRAGSERGSVMPFAVAGSKSHNRRQHRSFTNRTAHDHLARAGTAPVSGRLGAEQRWMARVAAAVLGPNIHDLHIWMFSFGPKGGDQRVFGVDHDVTDLTLGFEADGEFHRHLSSPRNRKVAARFPCGSWRREGHQRRRHGARRLTTDTRSARRARAACRARNPKWVPCPLCEPPGG